MGHGLTTCDRSVGLEPFWRLIAGGLWCAPSGRVLAMHRGEVGSLIHRLLERLARREADHPPGRNRGSGPGLGVAPDTRPLVVDLPRAKAAQDHGFPLP